MNRKDSTPKAKPPTEQEADERLKVCAELLIEHVDYDAATEVMNRFGIGRRAANDWLAKVRKLWAEGAKHSEGGGQIRATRGEHRARVLDLYRRAIKAGNLKVAGDQVLRLAQLDGHLTSKGPPEPPPEKDADPYEDDVMQVLKEVKEDFRRAGSVQALINEGPAMPTEDDLDPVGALRRRDDEIAKLKAQNAALEAQLASKGNAA